MTVDPWGDDLLKVKAKGATFTNLIKSIDDSKVISIEAGFGRGKTFFREAWAKHLVAQGEVVIEIDAQKSDHSGDPVVTFIGALVQALGPDDKTRLQRTKEAGLKYTGVAARTIAKAVLRQGADELIDVVEREITDGDDASEVLKTAVEGIGSGMSKFAGEMIAAQLTAESARTKELPEQLLALRQALTEKSETDRVVIIVDELDRCHPDYMISLLEAMKHVFDQDGYVFVLMVNADYLQKMAEHRFGKLEDGWEYLEKFVDIRLSLGTTNEVIGEAARALVMEKLDIVGVPFGEGPEFTVERAAEVAAQMAPLSGLSMRQIKRVLLKVEVALRCYQEVPLDLPLLVFLAFKDAATDSIRQWEDVQRQSVGQSRKKLPNRLLSYQPLRECRELWPIETLESGHRIQAGIALGRIIVIPVGEAASGLPLDRYRGLVMENHDFFKPDAKGLLNVSLEKMIQEGIHPWYRQEHQQILEQTLLLVSEEE